MSFFELITLEKLHYYLEEGTLSEQFSSNPQNYLIDIQALFDIVKQYMSDMTTSEMRDLLIELECSYFNLAEELNDTIRDHIENKFDEFARLCLSCAKNTSSEELYGQINIFSVQFAFVEVLKESLKHLDVLFQNKDKAKYSIFSSGSLSAQISDIINVYGDEISDNQKNERHQDLVIYLRDLLINKLPQLISAGESPDNATSSLKAARSLLSSKEIEKLVELAKQYALSLDERFYLICELIGIGFSYEDYLRHSVTEALQNYDQTLLSDESHGDKIDDIFQMSLFDYLGSLAKFLRGNKKDEDLVEKLIQEGCKRVRVAEDLLGLCSTDHHITPELIQCFYRVWETLTDLNEIELFIDMPTYIGALDRTIFEEKILSLTLEEPPSYSLLYNLKQLKLIPALSETFLNQLFLRYHLKTEDDAINRFEISVMYHQEEALNIISEYIIECCDIDIDEESFTLVHLDEWLTMIGTLMEHIKWVKANLDQLEQWTKRIIITQEQYQEIISYLQELEEYSDDVSYLHFSYLKTQGTLPSSQTQAHLKHGSGPFEFKHQGVSLRYGYDHAIGVFVSYKDKSYDAISPGYDHQQPLKGALHFIADIGVFTLTDLEIAVMKQHLKPEDLLDIETQLALVIINNFKSVMRD